MMSSGWMGAAAALSGASTLQERSEELLWVSHPLGRHRGERVHVARQPVAEHCSERAQQS
eukprot:6781287-Prymnesium_polylepis.1